VRKRGHGYEFCLAYSDLLTYVLTFEEKVVHFARLPEHAIALKMKIPAQTAMTWRACNITAKVYAVYDTLGNWSRTLHWSSFCSSVSAFLKALQKGADKMARFPLLVPVCPMAATIPMCLSSAYACTHATRFFLDPPHIIRIAEYQ
jgi:hypothetical protein